MPAPQTILQMQSSLANNPDIPVGIKPPLAGESLGLDCAKAQRAMGKQSRGTQ